MVTKVVTSQTRVSKINILLAVSFADPMVNYVTFSAVHILAILNELPSLGPYA